MTHATRLTISFSDHIHALLKAALEEEHRQALEQHRQQAASEQAHVQTSIRGLEEEMRREEELHIDRVRLIQKEYEGRVVSLREAYQQTAQETKAKHGSAKALLEAQLSEMMLAQHVTLPVMPTQCNLYVPCMSRL